MRGTITLPLWLAAVVAVLAAVAFVERFLLPGAKWLVKRRVNRVLEEVDARLHIRIQPFKLTKRQVLIDRLLNDPAVLAAVDAEARGENLPRDGVFARAARYAEEIVPAFNAYVYFRLGYWLARQAARSLYRVRLGAAGGVIPAVPESATVVFLMNHRSNWSAPSTLPASVTSCSCRWGSTTTAPSRTGRSSSTSTRPIRRRAAPLRSVRRLHSS